jgi:hypothetical protein
LEDLFGLGEMIETGSVNIPSFFASARERRFRCFKGGKGFCPGAPVLGGLLEVLIVKLLLSPVWAESRFVTSLWFQ